METTKGTDRQMPDGFSGSWDIVSVFFVVRWNDEVKLIQNLRDRIELQVNPNANLSPSNRMPDVPNLFVLGTVIDFKGRYWLEMGI